MLRFEVLRALRSSTGRVEKIRADFPHTFLSFSDKS